MHDVDAVWARIVANRPMGKRHETLVTVAGTLITAGVIRRRRK
jgi:hypothetical protein